MMKLLVNVRIILVRKKSAYLSRHSSWPLFYLKTCMPRNELSKHAVPGIQLPQILAFRVLFSGVGNSLRWRVSIVPKQRILENWDFVFIAKLLAYILVSFLGWGETESIWYVGH
jgi:hypothetical protein